VTSPFLSIVTIVRNNADGLMRTRASLAEQVDQDFEWVVADGNSSDDTRQVLAAIEAAGDGDVQSGRDTGIYDAMNKGLRRASGTLVCFLNAGDILAGSDATAIVRRAHAESEAVDILFFSSIMDFGVKKVVRPVKPASYIWHGQPAMHQGTLFRTGLHKQHEYDDRYRIVGDYECLTRMLRAGARATTRAECFNINEFSWASTSNSKLALMREAWMVQRDVLQLPLSRRTVSLGRRAINSAAFKAMTFARRGA
jgi:putative colanic acid biosynthesis glycosyltransferase